MARNEWAAMGCGAAEAEFQCIRDAYGGNIDRASEVWKKHWGTWITAADLDEMVGAGLNTIRVGSDSSRLTFLFEGGGGRGV